MKNPRAPRLHRVGLLLAGVVSLIVIAVGATVALPATDSALDSRSPAARTFDASATRGMRIFAAEGCWYCHTQQVRDTATDAGLGTRLKAGDYNSQDPALIGLERVGPDLSHIGASRTSDDFLELFRTPHPPMPSYEYLTERQQRDLAAYLLALR